MMNKINSISQINNPKRSYNHFDTRSQMSHLINQIDLNKMSHHNNSLNHLNINHLNQSTKISEIDLQFDDDEQFYIPIEGYETLEKRTKFTVYKLKVENIRTGLHWYVFRRFTDFARLNDKLKTKFPNLDDLNLPGKSFFDNVFNPLFIEKRQLHLQLYLNRLMSNKKLLNEPVVRRFICVDEPPLLTSTISPNDTLTYPSSVCSDSCDRLYNPLFTCNNCCVLERKLDEMQLQIKRLQEALNAAESKNSSPVDLQSSSVD